MNKDWETIFRSWTKPPSDSEDQRCENAENMVRKAIEADGILSRKGVRVFTQGSYRHNTNVRLNSDVDVNVCLIDCIFYRLPALQSPSDYGIGPCTYPYPEFKNQVAIALVNKFGRKSVTRGNKAFDIHANGYRVDADVVACFEYRLYTGQTDYYGNHIYLSGTELQA